MDWDLFCTVKFVEFKEKGIQWGDKLTRSYVPVHRTFTKKKQT